MAEHKPIIKDATLRNKTSAGKAYVNTYKKSSKQPVRKLSSSYGKKSIEKKKLNSLEVSGTIFGLIVMLLLAISFIRTAFGLGVATESLSFRALLEILQNAPVIDFASKIEIPVVNIGVDWLEWIELLINPSIRIINLLVWIVSQLFNFLSFVSYMLFELLGLNLGF